MTTCGTCNLLEFEMSGGRLLRYPQLKTEKGIDWCRFHIATLEKQGAFPRRVRLGGRTIGWVEAEIDALIAARIAEREPHATPG